MSDRRDWMWSEAIDMLGQAERLHRQFFRPGAGQGGGWEPPVDVLETEHDVLILTALPGVAPENVKAVIQEGVLIISGQRSFPAALSTAKIHRLELPQGRFERRVRLPAGRYDHIKPSFVDGCLIVSLHKSSGGA